MPSQPEAGCGVGVDDEGAEIPFISFEEIKAVLHPITLGLFDRYLRGDDAATGTIDELQSEGKLTVKSKS